MRVGLFSDVHANAVALAAVLEDLERRQLDRIVCLGDHVQGGAQPAECLDRLRELRCPVVLGNADHEVLFPQREHEEWTRARLSVTQLEFMRTFEATVEIELGDGGRLVCFHGSPRSFDEVVLPETPLEDVRAAVAGHEAVVFAGGHVHLQWQRRVGSAVWLCAGSVGLVYANEEPAEALRLDPWAEYAIVDFENGCLGVELRRVPFDVEAYVQALLASGRPGADETAAGWLT